MGVFASDCKTSAVFCCLYGLSCNTHTHKKIKINKAIGMKYKDLLLKYLSSLKVVLNDHVMVYIVLQSESGTCI